MQADIFCRVVDNYGDIGVCWRLARRLAHGHGWEVRLWVDDLASFARIQPGIDAGRARPAGKAGVNGRARRGDRSLRLRPARTLPG